MKISERIDRLFESFRTPKIFDKSYYYAAQSYKEGYRFVSGWQTGKNYVIVKDGQSVNGQVLWKPHSMTEYHKHSLACVPYAVKLSEATIEEFEHKGGQIVFSTDVNATAQGKGILGRLGAFVKRTVETTLNRLFAKKKVKDIMKAKDIYAYSIGNFFRGNYYDKAANKQWSEKSLAVEIIGVSPDVLQELGQAIMSEFDQQSVLIKEYDTGRIYLLK